MVQRLARGPFKAEIRVRFSLALPILLALILFAPFAAFAQKAETFVSPDDSLRAEIQSVRRSSTATPESKIEILSKDGKRVWIVKYTSADGEHGFGVVKAAWTPDSQYFVYSLASSGGHQAWRSPTFFYDRRNERVRSFDEEVGVVIDAKFSLSPPDVVEIVIRDNDNGEAKNVKIALSDLQGYGQKK
jgi:hypothetical protein